MCQIKKSEFKKSLDIKEKKSCTTQKCDTGLRKNIIKKPKPLSDSNHEELHRDHVQLLDVEFQ